MKTVIVNAHVISPGIDLPDAAIEISGSKIARVSQTARPAKNDWVFDAKGAYVVPGFIARDSDSHETTNLGRGGSDYTAAIIAAALDAECLEIWTDVDGFMTADPKVIKSAYTINELSYVEAMELCNFGAKVIYPPTIYPVCIKHIPIKVKNTFNPEHPGTLIKDKIDDDLKPIKGISSIKGPTLITVTGLSMVGVIGVNRRIYPCSWSVRPRRKTPPVSVCATRMPTPPWKCSTMSSPRRLRRVPCSPCTQRAGWQPSPSWVRT